MPRNMPRAFGVAVLSSVAWVFVVGALQLSGSEFHASGAAGYGFIIFLGSFIGAGLVLGGCSPRGGER